MLTQEQIQQYKTGMNATPAMASSTQPATHDWVDSLVHPTNSAPKVPPGTPPGAQFGGSGSMGEGFVNTLKEGGENAVQAIKDIPKNAKAAGGKTTGGKILDYGLSTLQAAGHEAGNIAGTAGGLIGDALAPFLPEAVKSKVGDVASFINTGVDKIPGMTPEIHKGLSDIFNTLTLEGGAKGAPLAEDAAKAGLAKAAPIAEDAVNTAKNTMQDVTGKIKTSMAKAPVDATADLEKAGIKDATPHYNKNLVGEAPIKNEDGTTMPRISEVDSKNPFKERTVNSTSSEKAAGQELSKVPGYDPKATALDKYNHVADYNTKQAQALETSLKNEKLAVPRKEINSMLTKAVNGASENSVLLQKTDPIVKNYLRVTQRAIKNADGTLAGELQVRKALDRAYDDAGGKYGNNKGLDQIHRAARNALNDDMEARAQSTQVKASLKQQSNLYKAADVLKDKARAEGGSKFEQLAKKYPIASKVGKTVGRYVGLGEAMNHLP